LSPVVCYYLAANGGTKWGMGERFPHLPPAPETGIGDGARGQALGG